MQVLFLSQEDPLEALMSNHSSILAWRFPWTGDHGRHSPCSPKESEMTEVIEQAANRGKETSKAVN